METIPCTSGFQQSCVYPSFSNSGMIYHSSQLQVSLFTNWNSSWPWGLGFSSFWSKWSSPRGPKAKAMQFRLQRQFWDPESRANCPQFNSVTTTVLDPWWTQTSCCLTSRQRVTIVAGTSVAQSIASGTEAATQKMQQQLANQKGVSAIYQICWLILSFLVKVAQFLNIVHSWTTAPLQHTFGLGKNHFHLTGCPCPTSHSHRRRDAFKLDDPRQFLRAIGTVRRQRSPGSSPRASSGSVDTNGSETFRVSDKLWRMSLTHVTYHILKAELAQYLIYLSLSLYGHLFIVTPCKAAAMLYIYIWIYIYINIFHGIYPPWQIPIIFQKSTRFSQPWHRISTSKPSVSMIRTSQPLKPSSSTRPSETLHKLSHWESGVPSGKLT